MRKSVITYPARALGHRGYPATGLAVTVWLLGLGTVAAMWALSCLLPLLPPVVAVALAGVAVPLALAGRLIVGLGLLVVGVLALLERFDPSRASAGEH
ncbi:hypothetical protein SAMN05428942_7263 [Streptomyces sp. 2112.2]|uniref:hypothetical protein n=1 Tax=Streptomyces sp. 2112.2 TaxID=1881024 RepID=UPI0008956688|nr:hypothetical protein [Streptomyces sp. 2112.2]SEF16398.1 hypothetical protein SAMN05428942_7263 [Streptomyces sp. 2112.2]